MVRLNLIGCKCTSPVYTRPYDYAGLRYGNPASTFVSLVSE